MHLLNFEFIPQRQQYQKDHHRGKNILDCSLILVEYGPILQPDPSKAYFQRVLIGNQ